MHDAEAQRGLHAELRDARTRHQVAEDVGEHGHGNADRRACRDRRRDRRQHRARACHDDLVDDHAPDQIRQFMQLVDGNTDERRVDGRVVLVEQSDHALAPAGMFVDEIRGQARAGAASDDQHVPIVPAQRARDAQRSVDRDPGGRNQRKLERHGDGCEDGFDGGQDRGHREIQDDRRERQCDPDPPRSPEAWIAGAGTRRARARRARAARSRRPGSQRAKATRRDRPMRPVRHTCSRRATASTCTRQRNVQAKQQLLKPFCSRAQHEINIPRFFSGLPGRDRSSPPPDPSSPLRVCGRQRRKGHAL